MPSARVGEDLLAPLDHREPRLVRGRRDREQEEWPALRHAAQRVDADVGAALGQAVQVRRYLRPVGEHGVGAGLEAEARGWRLLGGKQNGEGDETVH